MKAAALALLLVAAAPGFAGAATGAAFPPAVAAATADPEEHEGMAPVVLDGRVLFEVRGLLARPAPMRATTIAQRIEQAARDPAVAPAELRVEDTEYGVAIVAGTQRLMIVSEEDASSEGAARSVVAVVYRQIIADAITEYRAARTPERLTKGLTVAVAAVVALLTVVVALWYVVRALDRMLTRRLGGRVRDVGIQSLQIVSARTIWRGVRFAIRAAAMLAALAAIYFSTWFALAQFPGTRATAARLGSLALQPLHALGVAALAALPSVLFLAVLVVVTRYVLRLVRLLFLSLERGQVAFEGFDAEWSMPTYRIVRVLVIAFALIVAYPYIPGSDSAAFKGVSVFLGVMFSLGSTSVIANIIAGYSMTYRRAFRVGDLIKAGDAFGVVTDIRVQVTHLRNPRNEELIVPNSQLLQQTVVNYSTLARDQGLVLHTEVGIGYETPWRQVEAMLLAAADRAAGFLKEPKPFVRQRSLGDFAVVYELNVHTRREREMPALYTELHRHILDVFNEYGVQIMTPAYEGDPAVPKVVSKDQWFLAPGTEVRPAVAPEAPQAPAGPGHAPRAPLRAARMPHEAGSGDG